MVGACCEHRDVSPVRFLARQRFGDLGSGPMIAQRVFPVGNGELHADVIRVRSCPNRRQLPARLHGVARLDQCTDDGELCAVAH
jgi:hypothetical protein